MINAKNFSEKMAAVKYRISRLPKKYQEILYAQLKRDAEGLIREYQDGIRDKKFDLEPLKPETIRRKAREGAPRPDTPLYEWGDTQKDSLINGPFAKKTAKGYTIMWGNRKHHKFDGTIKKLHMIHEYGITIVTRDGVTIRIPPRPAWRMAYIKYMNRYKQEESAKAVKNEITKLVRSA